MTMEQTEFLEIQRRLGKKKKLTNIMLAALLARSPRQIWCYRGGKNTIPERVAWAIRFFDKFAQANPTLWEDLCLVLRHEINLGKSKEERHAATKDLKSYRQDFFTQEG